MLTGKQTWLFDRKPYIISASTVVGPDEGAGPLGDRFDMVHSDYFIGEDSWEKAERKFLEESMELTLDGAGLQKKDISFYVGGDLLNQIVSNTFAARTMAVPYIGVFGACSTSMESLALASLMVNYHSANYAMAGVCSHNCSAEKQFRYPTEYGSQKPPTAQFTVTGAGTSLLSLTGKPDMPRVTSATIGKIVDMGIKDPFNMGAAMAPAAVDTMHAHFHDRGIEPGYYDMIVTGDLAKVGYSIAKDLLKEKGIDIGQTDYQDCGILVFDPDKQMVQAGGSGAACSAVVTYGHLLKKMREGELKRLLVVATGALMSPITFQQGESIPCIAHAVSIEME
ncbi:stage V sporulation protein AD [Paenibacillus turpanensis]|uniref:stage V sporulation protein AD n=1 Tax=Paenibacillus turpanensis TaxID=2689078 RepID=UPI00140C847C|nr:stage V sporulation protein AD [Paenibacillus turpanensis]